MKGYIQTTSQVVQLTLMTQARILHFLSVMCLKNVRSYDLSCYREKRMVFTVRRMIVLITECILLLSSFPSVSGLCSTCIENRCYENGSYCDEECPSKCLNNLCHIDRIGGTATCTDGCEPGFCDIQCEVECPGDCVTCDRQCGSCNGTLCPERHYGADCSEVCSPEYGKCDRETGQCIICRLGYYGDECTRVCKGCFTRADNIRDTCLSGCDICQAEESCPIGFHGSSCKHKCSPGCDNSVHGCNRATRECSVGCVSGYYGLNCNYTCSERCLSGNCNRVTGECSAGCVSGYYGLNCNYTCSENCLSGKCNRAIGECSAGCVSGYYGLICNYSCNMFCFGGICSQHDGICTSGCISGYISNSNGCYRGSMTNVTPIVINTCICIILLMMIAVLVWTWRRSGRYIVEASSKRSTTRIRRRTDTASNPMIACWTKQDFTENAVQLLPEEFVQVQRLKLRTSDEIKLHTAEMVRVSAVDIVLQKLEAGQQWVTITGNAGDGKTTLGYLVLKEFLQKNVNVVALYKPEEYGHLTKMKEDCVLMFDDRFGAFLADPKLIKKWLDVIKELLNENDTINIRVIFVSRKNVVNESKMYLGQYTDKLFDPKCVVDLSRRVMTDERLHILKSHLDHEKVKVNHELQKAVAGKEIAHGFPHCCKMYSKIRSSGYDVDIADFFESPLKFLDTTTKVLYTNNCKELFQLMIRNDGQFDVHTVEDEDKRQELLQVEKEQEGSYITVWKNGICRFAHPSVYESVLDVINEIDPLYTIQYATLSVIRQKMLITPSYEESYEEDRRRYPCYIIVKPIPVVLKALAERFRKEILKGDYSVFKHRLCQSRDFCEALVYCCVNSDLEENASKRFINKPGEDGNVMLWIALKNRNMAAVQVLVKAKADVNIQDEKGRTPLHYHCQVMHPFVGAACDDDDLDQQRVGMKIMRMIITDGKGDVNLCDHNGQTPLHYVCQVRNSYDDDGDDQQSVDINVIRFLITEGRGDVNIWDHYGHTPLHYLLRCRTVCDEDLKWIITEGKGDLNIREQNKSTPLHYLCGHPCLQLDTVDLVIKKGKGNFNIGDEHGTTPLHYLCVNEEVELDVVLHIVTTAKGDINKQDDNGITPLHFLCNRPLPIHFIPPLINQGVTDSNGNTQLHWLYRRRGIIADGLLQQLEKLHRLHMKTPNVLGHTPLQYLMDQDDSLSWTDGTINRSAADLVLCRMKRGDKCIVVLGSPMTLCCKRVHRELRVEHFNQELTNMGRMGDRSAGQFSVFSGTCSSPIFLPPSPSNLQTASYWETDSILKWKKANNPLLEMGVTEDQDNVDKFVCISRLPRSVSVSVTDDCLRHSDHLCIQVIRTDQDTPEQLGECVTLSCPTPGQEYNFIFGLVLDVARGVVAFIDVRRGELLCKVGIDFKRPVFPVFYVSSLNDFYPTTMMLVSGRKISLYERKVELIKQALSN